MDEMNHTDPESITPKHIDIQKVLAAKNVKLPNWLVGRMERLLHLDDINHCIYLHRDKFGLDFVCALLDTPRPDGLDLKVEVVNPHNIPQQGCPIIAGNHPLGGPDGLALMRAIGPYRNDIRFPVNDFLLHIPGLAPLFIPIDKVHHNAANAHTLEQAFAEPRHLDPRTGPGHHCRVGQPLRLGGVPAVVRQQWLAQRQYWIQRCELQGLGQGGS